MHYLFVCLLTIPGARGMDIRPALADSVARRLPSKWSVTRKRRYSTQLVSRIIIEARRRRLDPVIMTAIAWTESIYRHWVRRPGDGSYGVWQIIPWDTAPSISEKELAGCKPGPNMSYFWREWWRRRLQGQPCASQDIANYRRKYGMWSGRELMAKDNVISTYLAAHEIDMHRTACRARKHRPHLINSKHCRRLPLSVRTAIGRYSHFNSGPRKPKWHYIATVCNRYDRIKQDIIRALPCCRACK